MYIPISSNLLHIRLYNHSFECIVDSGSLCMKNKEMLCNQFTK